MKGNKHTHTHTQTHTHTHTHTLHRYLQIAKKRFLITNARDRFNAAPRGGSSSQPVTNCKIFSKLTVFLLPPKNKIHR